MKNYGEGRFEVLCSDGITRIGKACNQMRKIKEKKIAPETYVIISLRECDTKDDKCDILGFADPPKDIIKYFKLSNNENIIENEILFIKNKNNENTNNENTNEDNPDEVGEEGGGIGGCIGSNGEFNIDDL
jgi:translation initiation factor IF-1